MYVGSMALAERRIALVQGVFLDLPSPWKAAASAVACLVPNGVFISFSPCIEQVRAARHHDSVLVLHSCGPSPCLGSSARYMQHKKSTCPRGILVGK